jgi:hypothetical protein
VMNCVIDIWTPTLSTWLAQAKRTAKRRAIH